MDAKARRRALIRAASPKFISNAFTPTASNRSLIHAGPKDTADGTTPCERTDNLLKPPPMRRGAPVLSDTVTRRRRPTPLPCRAEPLKPGGASLQRGASGHSTDSAIIPSRHPRPARVRRLPSEAKLTSRDAALSLGIGRRNIVLDAKQQCANAPSGGRGAGEAVCASPARAAIVRRYWQLCEDVGQAPQEAWVQAVLAGGTQKVQEQAASPMESRPPLARTALKEGRPMFSAFTRLPRINSSKTSTATARSTSGEGWTKSYSRSHSRAPGFLVGSSALRGNGANPLVSSPGAVGSVQTASGTTVEHMIAYCRKLQPYQKRMKELRQRRNDVHEALRRFVDRCYTHRRPGGSNLSAMTVLEGQANSLTEGLRELQRYSVALLLRFSECSHEVRRPLGSSQHVAQQPQKDQQVGSPKTQTSVPGVMNPTVGSGLPEKSSAVKKVSIQTTGTVASQLDLPPYSLQHSLSHETPEGYLRFLREEESRIVQELRNMCARVRQVLKHDSAVMFGDTALLDTPLFLPSPVSRSQTETTVFSSTKSGTNTTSSHSASANSIRPLLPSGSRGVLCSAGSATMGEKPSGSHNKHSSDDTDLDATPFVGVSLGGLQGGTEASNARLVLGGGRRFCAMNGGALPPLAQGPAQPLRSKSANCALAPKRGVSKGSAGVTAKRANGKPRADVAVGRTPSMPDAFTLLQMREAEGVWEIICAMADAPLPLHAARQKSTSPTRNEAAGEAREPSPTPSQPTAKIPASASKSKFTKVSPVPVGVTIPTSMVGKSPSLSAPLETMRATEKAASVVQQTGSDWGGDENGVHEQVESPLPFILQDNSSPTVPEQILSSSRALSLSLELSKTKGLQRDVRSASPSLCPREPNTQTGSYTDIDAKKSSSGMHRCSVQKLILSKLQEAEQEQPKLLMTKNAELLENTLKTRPLLTIMDLTLLSVDKAALWAKMATCIARCWRMYWAKMMLEKLRAHAAEKRCKRQQIIYESTMIGRIQRFFSIVITRRKFREAMQRHRGATPLYLKDSERNTEVTFERFLSVREYFEKVKKSRTHSEDMETHSTPNKVETRLDDKGHNAQGSKESPLFGIPSLKLETHNLSTFTIDTYTPGTENFDVVVLHRLLRAPKAVLYMLRVMCEHCPRNRDSAEPIFALPGESGRRAGVAAGKQSHDDSIDTNAFSRLPSLSYAKPCSTASVSSIKSSSKGEKDEEKQNGWCTSQEDLRKSMQWELRPHRVVRRERMLAEAQRYVAENPTVPFSLTFSTQGEAGCCPVPLSVRVESFVEDLDVFHAVPIEKPVLRPFEHWGTSYAFQSRVFNTAAIYAWKLIFSHTPHDDYKQGLLKTFEEQEARLARVDQRNRMILACYCVRSEKEWLKEASKDLAFVAHIWNPKKSLDPNDPDFERHCHETYEFVEDFLYQCFPSVTNLEDVPAFLTGAGIFFLLKGLLECHVDGALSCESTKTVPPTANSVSSASPDSAVLLKGAQHRVVAVHDLFNLLDCLTDWCRQRSRAGEEEDCHSRDGERDTRSSSWEDTPEQAKRHTATETGELPQSEVQSSEFPRESVEATPDMANRARRRVRLSDMGDAGGMRLQYERGFLVSLSERLTYNLLGISLDLEVCEDLDAVA